MAKKELSSPVKQKQKVIANKQTMNFAYHQSSINWKKFGIISAVVLVVLVIFAKFAILDQLAIKNEAIAARDAATSRLAKVNARMADYNKLKAEYDRLTDSTLIHFDRELVNRRDVFDFIYSEVLNRCEVSKVNIKSNELTLGLRNISLADLGELITDLNEHELVYHIELRSAYSDDSDVAIVELTIHLQKGADKNEEA